MPPPQSSVIKPIPVDSPQPIQQNQEYQQYVPGNNAGNQPIPFQVENAPMIPNQQYYHPSTETYTINLPFKKSIKVRMNFSLLYYL